MIKGDLDVRGKIENQGLVKQVLDALPFGPIEKCHGCNSKSFGFQWDTEMEGEKEGEVVNIDRQMCLECLYNVMLIERVRSNEQERNQNE